MEILMVTKSKRCPIFYRIFCTHFVLKLQKKSPNSNFMELTNNLNYFYVMKLQAFLDQLIHD
ncbi:hypothetical protein BpHYR1_038024 [Brachionus plicatilis]|uniref:Uncharacterized protein n=1 Tax=Brachionus plicatilis TaxID=10195 RepID=A0A3M7QPL8_BRAPC|nr:hypothetical protein BpHYR1_038024 [Brachionus plicatilis]